MERHALVDLRAWYSQPIESRKPLIIRGARQVGKSFLVRDFCRREQLRCLELNFEKEPSLRRLFVDGPNARTVSHLETHFDTPLDSRTVLFFDEIQAAPEVFARLRYFYEDNPEIAVIGAGSLLEFALAELEFSVPVGRIEYLYLGPMTFEEFLFAAAETSRLSLIETWNPNDPKTDIPELFHEQLTARVADFSVVGGMPEAIARFLPKRDFRACASSQRTILETYREDFAKFRKRIPLERIDRVFSAIAAQVGKKWVHARINPNDRAQATEAALEALCFAKVAHRVFHSSANAVPLRAEKKDNLYKVIFLDVGLMGGQLGLTMFDMDDPTEFERANEGAVAEQWIGQHLIAMHGVSHAPEIYYWVREKAGAMAEVDYVVQHRTRIVPIEVKAGATTRAKSLHVFLNERPKSRVGVHISSSQAHYDRRSRILSIPFYLIGQLPRLLDACNA